MKIFNIIICGVGGQGLITLLQLIAQAAFDEGFDVKTSELHGLSQRGGSVNVHIRFGKEVFSPLIPRGEAALILALESQEALSAAEFASKETVFLINQYQTPTMGESVSEAQVRKNLKTITERLTFIPCTDLCQKEFGTVVTAGIFLLGYASFKNLIPLPPNSILKAIKKLMPPNFWDVNIKTFKLSKNYKP